MFDILTDTGMSQEMTTFYVVYLAAVLVMGVILTILCYIFQGIGMYTLAKRRKIHHPWLAWAPVANMWLLGCISDQFRYRVYGENTNRRRKLLIRNILLQVVTWVVCGSLIYEVYRFGNGMVSEEAFSAAVARQLLGIYGILALSVLTMILQYKCLFDLYRSCAPSRAVLFLLLSILAGAPMPFLVFACRKKDLGMTPKAESAPQYRLPNY